MKDLYEDKIILFNVIDIKVKLFLFPLLTSVNHITIFQIPGLVLFPFLHTAPTLKQRALAAKTKMALRQLMHLEHTI